VNTTHRCVAAGLAALALLISPAQGKEKDPTLRVPLEYSPQEALGSRVPDFGGKKAPRAVKIVTEDGRTGAVPAVVGDGTDDDDRPFDISAEGDVMGFAGEVVRRNFEEWSFPVDDASKTVLTLRLSRFWVAERNQAVGSMYSAEVRWIWTLTGESGETLGWGTASGDTKRYGKERSRENCTEVLSDALKEAKG